MDPVWFVTLVQVLMVFADGLSDRIVSPKTKERIKRLENFKLLISAPFSPCLMSRKTKWLSTEWVGACQLMRLK